MQCDITDRAPWPTTAQFLVLTRLRLGMPVSDIPRGCTLCHGSSVADIFGVHSIACTGSGAHTLAHNELRKAVHLLASAANQSPLAEQRPFPLAPTKRIDILLRPQSGAFTAIDVALISPLTRNHVLHAMEAPGGASTAYEQVKRNTYGAEAADARIVLAPVIVDSFGAWSETAVSLLSRLIRLKAERYDITPSVAIAAEFRKLGMQVQMSIARLILFNAGSA